MIQIPAKHIEQLKSFIDSAQKITIITHTNPDGDTIGSSLAISNLLVQLGKETKVITPDELPDFLNWLPNANESIDYSKDSNIAEKAMNDADLIFCMDYNAAHRTGNFASVLEKANVPKIMIDHHLFPDEDFFDLLFSYPESSSTSELFFHIIEAAGWIDLIDESIATPLFVGIMTDTGSFAHSCDRKEVFEVTANLIEFGDLKIKAIHDKIYNNFKENRLRFLGYCISNKLIVRAERRTAYIWVSLEDMQKFDVSEGDLEGIVNYALSIEGIELAVLLKEKKEVVKLSFRSRAVFNVNMFAREYFNGGGHFNAAGGKSRETMADTIEKLERLINTIEI